MGVVRHNMIASFNTWRTLAQFRTNMASMEEILKLERSGMQVALENTAQERTFLSGAHPWLWDMAEVLSAGALEESQRQLSESRMLEAQAMV